jgi:chemotaxis protein MotB
MPRKKEKAPEGAPDWMVTYGDMMTLLLCFFVILFSMSEIKQDRFQPVIESMKKVFGWEGSPSSTPIDNPPLNTIIQHLQQIIIPELEKREGDSDTEGIDGRVLRVTDVREGISVDIGGRTTFERYNAVVGPESEDLLSKLAAKIVGHNTIIKITGHTTKEPLPSDSPFRDLMDLSIARARAVADVMIANGVRRERIRIVGAADTAPLLSQAYTEDRLAMNRRVEIVVTEELMEDFKGKTISEEKEQMRYGR